MLSDCYSGDSGVTSFLNQCAPMVKSERAQKPFLLLTKVEQFKHHYQKTIILVLGGIKKTAAAHPWIEPSQCSACATSHRAATE